MKRIILLSFILHTTISLFAQLDLVAPLKSVVYNAAKIENLNLLVSTKDFTSTFFSPKKDSFYTTVQLVSAANPFPPKWYQIGTDTLTALGKIQSDFFLDPEIQEKTGHLSFNFIFVPDAVIQPSYSGYVVLDTLTLLPIDTLDQNSFTIDSIFQAVDNHEYKEDQYGNKMILTQIKTFMDIRCLSGIPADSMKAAIVEYIVVLDSANHPKFIWNPLKNISPCEMHWEWRNSSVIFPGALNWSHGNSVAWANDGNILYSLRHVGIGKINSTTGEVMFKLGGKDSINSIHIPDSIDYSLQHNFYQRPDGKYMLFSNGDDSLRPYMEGMVYDIDEVNKTAVLYDRYKPQPNCISKALGGFEKYNDLYVFNRGMNFCSHNQMVDIVNISDKSSVASIYGPSNNFSYRAHATKWNVSLRPKVTSAGNQLISDEPLGLGGFTWYKINNLSAVKVGTGLIFNPSSTGKYVVEARIGTGRFKSYLVSDPVDFVLTSIRNSIFGKIDLYYNSSDHIAFIDLKESSGILRIFNMNGQLLNEVSLHTDHNEVYFRDDPGIYIFEVTTEKDHMTARVFSN